MLAAAGPAAGFPWAVFAVNVAGSALVGVALAEEATHPRARLLLGDGLAVGFCGGLTTFSTLAVETADLARDGRGGLAVVYVVASVVAGIVAALAGAAAFRRTRALMLPVEGVE